ncbi:hypothetical protein [Phreatobacter stygius]|uniref:Uncharacterized protein n=1 Tax=Phreatobacter stygius TaxID=1940610 RepID=A0A4D7B7N4_9HYPH|nr:hypothetical protein [Phreatobacter stygius]QCI65656.1 hypothetical protein E8M01_16440 [Phreatobacter stygius]
MAIIHWKDGEVRLASFSSRSNGSKSAVTVRLETSNPRAFGWLLEELAELDRAQRAAARVGRRKPAPQLLLEDLRGVTSGEPEEEY